MKYHCTEDLYYLVEIEKTTGKWWVIEVAEDDVFSNTLCLSEHDSKEAACLEAANQVLEWKKLA